MIKEKVYNLLDRAVSNSTNRDYVSKKGIFLVSLLTASLVLITTIKSSIKSGHPVKVIIFLSVALTIGTFFVLYINHV